MKRRALLSSSVGIVALSPGCLGENHPLPAIEGSVTSKSVVARRSGGAGSADATAARLYSAPSSEGSVEQVNASAGGVVSETGAATLDERYDELTYLVTVEHRSHNYAEGVAPGETYDYLTARSLFNAFVVGDDVAFQINPIGTSHLTSIQHLERRGTVVAKTPTKRAPDGDDTDAGNHSTDAPNPNDPPFVVGVTHRDGAITRRYRVDEDLFAELDTDATYRFTLGVEAGRVVKDASAVGGD